MERKRKENEKELGTLAIEWEKRKSYYERQEEIKAAKADADRLEGKTFKLTAKAGANGKLFGSVNAKDVAAEIKKELGIEIDKRKISMDDIKQFGTAVAEVKVYQGITAKIYVQVTEV